MVDGLVSKYKILVSISNRTNYSKLRPILLLLKKQKDVETLIIASSGIVVSKLSNAINDIESDGLVIAEQIDCLLSNDTLESMSKTVGISLIEHSSIISKISPDLLLVVGDRFDLLPAVLASKMLNIPIAHIQGGEHSGSIDDYVRDIVTVCSSLHYVSTEQSYRHVMSIAHQKNVLHVGCPAVEAIYSMDVGDYLDTSRFIKNYKSGFNISRDEPYLLVMVHPNTESENEINMETVLESCLTFNMKMIILYPNVDAFNHCILDSIRKFSSLSICVKHMPLNDFVHVMSHASCMVGNSSAGIREASSFGTPVVSIGKRQDRRELNKNTISCDCKFNEISDAIKRSLKIGKYPIENIYYKEDCSKNIVSNILGFLQNG